MGAQPVAAESHSVEYTVIHLEVGGPTDSEQAVSDAARTTSAANCEKYVVTTLGAGATNATILSAANALTDHSITINSRYIDADWTVHNFEAGKSTYWLIKKTEIETVTDATYTVTHVKVDGSRDSEQAVANATATATGSGTLSFVMAGNAPMADILFVADTHTQHNINSGSRYIDARDADNISVHNFKAGKSTYWRITTTAITTN